MVSYYEFDHSPTEEYTTDGSFIAKRRLGCAWADRYTVLNLLAAGGTSIYPYNNLGAGSVGATIIPFNDEPNAASGDTTKMQYGTAVVTITYAITSYYPRVISGRMMIEEIHPWMEYRTLPNSKMHAGSAGGAATERDARVLVPGLDYTLTSWGHVSLSVNAMNLIGYVNQSVWNMYMLGITVAAEHMLYMGPSPRIAARLGKSPDIAIGQMWKIRGQPWTKELTENGWEYMYNDAGNKIYTAGDFRWLQPSWL